MLGAPAREIRTDFSAAVLQIRHALAMVEVQRLNWALRAFAFFFTAIFSGHTPPPASPGPAPFQCSNATDCTLARDRCGGPYAHANGQPMAVATPVHCPPATYVPSEPACNAGRCEAVAATSPSLRSCSTDAECMPLSWVCGGWWAVARSQEQAATAEVVAAARRHSCQPSTSPPPPPVACLEGICVTRAYSPPSSP